MNCDEIDDELVEMYALDKLLDAEVAAHLETCEKCKPRVLKARQWAEMFKKAQERQG